MQKTIIIAGLLLLFTAPIFSQKGKKETEKDKTETEKDKKTEKPTRMKESTYGALSFRSIGPAVTSGRISDFAVNPANYAENHEGKGLQWMKKMAQQKNCAVVGSLSVKENNHFFNRLYWVFQNQTVE